MKEVKFNTTSLISALVLWTLVILKVSGAVNISWLWVFAPIWLPIVLVLLGGFLVVVFMFILEIVDEYVKRY